MALSTLYTFTPAFYGTVAVPVGAAKLVELADLEVGELPEDTSDKVLLSNLGPGHVFAIISGDNSIQAGPTNGACVLAGKRLALAYVDDGFLSLWAVGDRAVVNVAIGI